MKLNARGQIFIEALLCLPMILLGTSILLGGLIYFSHQLLLSEWCEDYLLCQWSEPRSICQTQLENRLQTLQFYSFKMSFDENTEFLFVKIQMKSRIHKRLHFHTYYRISKDFVEKEIR